MKIICEPLFPKDAVLECTKYLRFCRGRNLMLNFTDLIHRKEPLRYKMDIFQQGQIGKRFRSVRMWLNLESQRYSALQVVTVHSTKTDWTRNWITLVHYNHGRQNFDFSNRLRSIQLRTTNAMWLSINQHSWWNSTQVILISTNRISTKM